MHSVADSVYSVASIPNGETAVTPATQETEMTTTAAPTGNLEITVSRA